MSFLSKIKEIKFGVNQCISGYVISQTMELNKIGCISAFRYFWFGPINSLSLCTEHFNIFGVIKCISGHLTGYQLFVYKSANIFQTVLVTHTLLFIDRNMHIIFLWHHDLLPCVTLKGHSNNITC